MSVESLYVVILALKYSFGDEVEKFDLKPSEQVRSIIWGTSFKMQNMVIGRNQIVLFWESKGEATRQSSYQFCN